MKKLEGKVAVINGGNSGIGLATAQRFVSDGAYVFITGRRQSELDAAVKQIGKDNVSGVQGDVSNLADLDRLYATVKEQKGFLTNSVAPCSDGVGHGSLVVGVAVYGGSCHSHTDPLTKIIMAKGFDKDEKLIINDPLLLIDRTVKQFLTLPCEDHSQTW
jgi:NAD(P)-dependent dehydrogenase (short-subunit alcohol dehydrogenase family)